MTTKLAITAVFMFAVVLGVGAIAPAMAAKADAPGQNKVTICHFDEEENKFVQITVPPHAAEKHKAKHGDVDPVDGSCPIIDTTAPVITLNGDNPVTIELNTEVYIEDGATVTDDVDGDITTSLIIGGDVVDESTLGTYVITYDAVDSSGNTATQITRDVNVVDTTAPVITLSGSDILNLMIDEEYIEQGATVTDNDPSTPSDAVVGGDLVDTSSPGTYIVTYDVTDPSGNNAVQITRTVNVS
ncbi:MAG: DUF5011 domain-containing protein [Crenarchaeota archaeon]|nr:MAG: DUF5011 domain-containing protein [Thermoproteota archaeon]RDJ34503.1 MAG: DUF5011 domain-containing protein [Thermoproteota archaeon]RDJ34843.1 MAG: DUF5011 domain-containing protein [Thermoproteota archaeon]RDJ38554.1 MAG: DUF5011 domain-containing protein [Thermoproteota archaeon]